jgi:addiction module RelE/StbE family toxin
MLEVQYKPTFLRSFKKLDSQLQDEVEEKIVLFRDSAQHKKLRVHKLHGKLRGCYSFSVNYAWRIVFEYESEQVVILLDVGNHDMYK